MQLKPIWTVAEDHNKERSTSLIGKVVYCHCQEPMSSLSYALTTAHIIGYLPAMYSAKTPKKEQYTFTSLADGMTLTMNLEKLIETLNDQPYVPIPSSVLSAIMLEKQPLK